MNTIFKYILLGVTSIMFIIMIPVTMSIFLTENGSNLNPTAIGCILIIVSILLFANTVFVLLIDVKKYDDQAHLRLVERRWYEAGIKLNQVIQKFEQEVKKQIIDDVVKNTK